MEINKYKKQHKKKNIYKNEKNCLSPIKYGLYGIKIISGVYITTKQLELCRRIITRITKRKSKVIISIRCGHPLTKKSLMSRMGKGCGNINSYISYLKIGKILVEINGISSIDINKINKQIKYKLPFKLVIIKREFIDA